MEPAPVGQLEIARDIAQRDVNLRHRPLTRVARASTSSSPPDLVTLLAWLAAQILRQKAFVDDLAQLDFALDHAVEPRRADHGLHSGIVDIAEAPIGDAVDLALVDQLPHDLDHHRGVEPIDLADDGGGFVAVCRHELDGLAARGDDRLDRLGPLAPDLARDDADRVADRREDVA